MTDTLAHRFTGITTTTDENVARAGIVLAGFIIATTTQNEPECVSEYDPKTDGGINGHTPPVAAALLAARFIRDTNTTNATITAAIVAASLAAGHVANSSLGEVNYAIAIGHDVAAQIVHGLHGHTDYNVSFTAGVLGAVTAANRLLANNETACLNAYGVAATQAARLNENHGDTAERVAADAADTAVEAALLASHGFTGPATGIDGRRGVLTIIAEHATFDAIDNTHVADVWAQGSTDSRPRDESQLIREVLAATFA